VKTFGGAGDDSITSLDVAPNGDVIAAVGSTDSNGTVTSALRLDSAGNLLSAFQPQAPSFDHLVLADFNEGDSTGGPYVVAGNRAGSPALVALFEAGDQLIWQVTLPHLSSPARARAYPCPGGSCVYLAGSDANGLSWLTVLDVTDGSVRGELPRPYTGEIADVVVAPDGSFTAIANELRRCPDGTGCSSGVVLSGTFPTNLVDVTPLPEKTRVHALARSPWHAGAFVLVGESPDHMTWYAELDAGRNLNVLTHVGQDTYKSGEIFDIRCYSGSCDVAGGTYDPYCVGFLFPECEVTPEVVQNMLVANISPGPYGGLAVYQTSVAKDGFGPAYRAQTGSNATFFAGGGMLFGRVVETPVSSDTRSYEVETEGPLRDMLVRNDGSWLLTDGHQLYHVIPHDDGTVTRTTGHDQSLLVAAAPNGDAFVAGRAGMLPFDSVFWGRLRSGGEVAWQKTLSLPGHGSIDAIAAAGDNFFGGGQVDGRAIFFLGDGISGGLAMEQSRGGETGVVAVDSLPGSYRALRAGGTQGDMGDFISRADWDLQLPGLHIIGARALPDGGAIVLASDGHSIVGRIGPNGERLWGNYYGGDLRSIASVSDGYLVAGRVRSSRNDWDGLLAKLDTDGRKVWARAYGGARDDVFTGVRATDDYLLVGGSTHSVSSTEEAWLLKLGTDGSVASGCASSDIEYDPTPAPWPQFVAHQSMSRPIENAAEPSDWPWTPFANPVLTEECAGAAAPPMYPAPPPDLTTPYMSGPADLSVPIMRGPADLSVPVYMSGPPDLSVPVTPATDLNAPSTDLMNIDLAIDGSIPGCTAQAAQIYVIDTSSQLYVFHPDTHAFTTIGPVVCDAQAGATPQSMAIDHNGKAWVLYSSGELFKVTINNNSTTCQTTSYTPNPGGHIVKGMAFANSGPGSPNETLYVSTDDSSNSGQLGTIDVTAFQLHIVGPLHGDPELSGDGNGDLWGFFPLGAAHVARIDKAAGGEIAGSAQPLALAGMPSDYALASYGSYLWVFLARSIGSPTTNTMVYSVDRAGALTQQVADSGKLIVGAGVSICAPTN
jgi:hypothetical protein